MEGEIERVTITAGSVSYLAVVRLSPDADGVQLASEVMVVVICPVVVALDDPRWPSEVLSAARWRSAGKKTVQTSKRLNLCNLLDEQLI